MEFKKISTDMEEEYLEFIGEFNNAGENVVPYAAGLHGKSFMEFIEETENYEKGVLPDPAHVPGTTFFLVEHGRILGAINIRHYLNDYLLKHGGHIGYGVRVSERGKGYAKKMLRFGLNFLRDMNVHKVLLTCDSENAASAKVILACGGVFENEIESDKRITYRYWIET